GQPLGRALRTLAGQSGVQIAYRTAIASGATAPAVRGTMTTEQALSRLLATSGLRYAFTGANTVTIHDPAAVTAGGSTNPDGSVVLDTVNGEGQAETAGGPVDGIVARRSATASKTDAALIETPQSISVVSREQMDRQSVTTVSESLRYTPGVLT